MMSLYQQRMVAGGILTTGVNNFNASHSAADVDQFIAAANSAFVDIRQSLEQDSLEGLLQVCKVNPIFKRNK